MTFSPRILLLIALLVAAAAAVGCGETVVDDVKLEEQLQHEFETKRGEKVKSVDCPSGVEVKPNTKFDCTIVPQKGEKETAVLLIRNDEADITLVETRSGDVDLSAGG
ncbi:MAG TPA: DUF4333 domain-containing protein [Solirubrobacterales bacterium]|jgi:hypothetical protein|nr:DUF4333 domain-containing protein [Solirubrobacterales bacterium]